MDEQHRLEALEALNQLDCASNAAGACALPSRKQALAQQRIQDLIVRRDRLAANIAHLDAAISALQSNPKLAELVDLIERA